MSDYYMAKKTKGIYDPASTAPFKLSRSKIDLFLNCPRCFYMDRRLGVGQPPGYPFNLNSAVDKLLKKEFDTHRASKTPHPLMTAAGLDAIPFAHPSLNDWRENFVGIQYLDPATNFLVFGAVDDIWVNPTGELMVVDYKSTSKSGEVSLDADWQIGYKRQMETYQWLLRHNNFTVSPTGYFVYCNGNADKPSFDAKLEFSIKVIPYTGDDSWVSKALLAAKDCLLLDVIPDSSHDCDFCAYREAAASVETKTAPQPVVPPVTLPPIAPKVVAKKLVSQPLSLFD